VTPVKGGGTTPKPESPKKGINTQKSGSPIRPFEAKKTINQN
jgi:hypothetical protein